MVLYNKFIDRSCPFRMSSRPWLAAVMIWLWDSVYCYNYYCSAYTFKKLIDCCLEQLQTYRKIKQKVKSSCISSYFHPPWMFPVLLTSCIGVVHYNWWTNINTLLITEVQSLDQHSLCVDSSMSFDKCLMSCIYLYCVTQNSFTALKISCISCYLSFFNLYSN